LGFSALHSCSGQQLNRKAVIPLTEEKMKSIKMFLILMFLFAIQSCKDSSNPIIPVDNSFIYPLKIGNQWDYNATVVYSNIRPDSIKNQLNNYLIKLKVSVTKETILDSLQMIEMKEESQGYPNAYSYYSNKEEGLFKYAYRNTPSLVLPKTSAVKKYFYKNNYYNSVEELIKKQEDAIKIFKSSIDSIIFLDQPRIIYKYPLDIGQEWVFSPMYVRINKEVIGKETVNTDLGSYECYKIQWKYDFNSDGNTDDDFIYYEYVSSKGLLKTSIVINNIAITLAENPDGIGYADVKYERILNGINF
jgi:hypothetical protein